MATKSPWSISFREKCAQILRIACGKAEAVKNDVSGLRKSGIHPFNPHIRRYEYVIATDVTEYVAASDIQGTRQTPSTAVINVQSVDVSNIPSMDVPNIQPADVSNVQYADVSNVQPPDVRNSRHHNLLSRKLQLSNRKQTKGECDDKERKL